MKVGSLFSGIGAFEKALTNIGVDFTTEWFCEIDKFAPRSYCAIHDEPMEKNLGDITKVDIESLPYVDLITHGSPCQDFSLAGLGKGGDKGAETRSSLMWNTVAIVEQIKPKYVVWENVKGVLGKKHRHNYDKYLDEMQELGYENYAKVLNAKDYGVPQNRERIFVVSIRKDIDKGYRFPEAEPLKIRLKDVLEQDVDEKYYLSDESFAKLKTFTTSFMPSFTEPTVCERRMDEGLRFFKDGCVGSMRTIDSCGDKRVVYPVIHTCGGGGQEIKIEVIGNYHESNHEASRIVSGDGLAPTVKENHGTITGVSIDYRIRKLTPKECWRLMSFSDDDYDKAQAAGISNSQLYKQAGNSIVVKVLERIFENLLKGVE